MRTKAFIFIIAIVWGVSTSFAQSVYPPFDEDSYVEQVKIKGQKPTIADFVNNLLKEPEDELFGHLSEMWERHLAGKPQKKNNTITVDIPHGYVKFESRIPEDNIVDTSEMCYWNCSDGKHKIVAFSNYLYVDGKFIQGQYTGVSFFLYENATRRLQTIAKEDIGAVDKFEPEWVLSGFDGENWYKEVNGEKIIMTKEAYDEWHDNYFPIVMYHLPQTGKDIVLENWTPKKTVMKVLSWDGVRFNAPNY